MLPFTPDQLEEALALGRVTKRSHPDHDLHVYNYSPEIQYARDWDDVTSTCRGLILDGNYNIVARALPKFFNYTEVIPDPVIFGKPCVASDKIDGSLGIIYPTPDGYQVATRGSFGSSQALWATEWLRIAYPDFSQPEGVTTLVEIVGEHNRIVVRYPEDELILLTAIHNDTGEDVPEWEIDWWDHTRAEIFREITDADSGYHYANTDVFKEKEGIVLAWPKYGQPWFRLKVKHADYVELHRIVTNFSPKRVWEVLATGASFLDLLEKVPDEWYDEMKKVQEKLISDFREIETVAKLEFHELRGLKTNRKDFAARAKQTTYPAIMFAMLDNKNYDTYIWKMLEPKEQ